MSTHTRRATFTCEQGTFEAPVIGTQIGVCLGTFARDFVMSTHTRRATFTCERGTFEAPVIGTQIVIMGNNQAGKGQRLSKGPQGRRDGDPVWSRVRRARSDVGSRRSLRETAKAKSWLRKSFKLRRSTSDVNVSYGGKGRGRTSPHLVQQNLRDEIDALPGSPNKPRRKRHAPRSSQSRSSKLRRSMSDVDISYRGQKIGDPRRVSKEESKYKIRSKRERLLDGDLEEANQGETRHKYSSPRTKDRKIRQLGDVQVSSALRRSMSDVDISYHGNRKGYTSPRPHPTRRLVTPMDKDPEDTTFKDTAEAAGKDDQRKHNSKRQDCRRRFGTPSSLRRSMSDVDVSYRTTDRETSPTHHKRLLYNVPPVEYAEDSSDGKISDENLVILGSFRAGEDTGRKGKDGRKPAEPVGAGAKIVTDLVDGVKQSLGIPEKDVKEGETTYTDQLPDLIQGWATRQYTDSKKDDDSGFIDNLMGRFNVFFGDESKGRKHGEQVILGSWAGGEDAGRRATVNDSGFIHNLKESLLSSAGIDEMSQHRSGKGGTNESVGLMGSWAGGEDSGRSGSEEPGPFGFLGSLRRSFRMSSGEDPAQYGGEDEPVSPVFSGTFVAGEDSGRNRKGGTSAPTSFRDYLPSFASTSEGSAKGRNDHSWFSPEKWWTEGKDQEAKDSPSWIQNLQNSMRKPWGEDKGDENTDNKARSVLDQWTGMDKARTAFERWKDKTQNKDSNNSNSGWQKRGYEDDKNYSQDRSRTRRFQTYPDSTGKRKRRDVDRECEMLDGSEEDNCTGETSNNKKYEHRDDVITKRSNWLEDEDTGSEDSGQSLIYGNNSHEEDGKRSLFPGKHRSSYLRRSLSDFDISYEENGTRSPVAMSRDRRSTLGDCWSNMRHSTSDMYISHTSVEDMYSPERRQDHESTSMSTLQMSEVDVIADDPNRKHTAPRTDRRVRERLRTTQASVKEQCKDEKGSVKKKKRNKKRTSGSNGRLLYNAPPMEYVVDSSDDKLSDENMVILGTFKAGEDNTGRRRGSQPIGGGAAMLSDFVGGVKTFLRLPKEETVEDRGTYEDHIPGILHNMVTGEAGKNQEENSPGLLDSLKRGFDSWTTGESEKRRPSFVGSWEGGEDTGSHGDAGNSGLLDSLKRRFDSWTAGESEKRRPAFVGSWQGGEDTGSHGDAGNSGFINSLKQSLWGDSGTREQGRPPIGSWAGGEDTGKDRSNVTEDSGPLGSLVNKVRSFWMPSDKDGRGGREDKPASSAFRDGWAGGEDTGRDRQESGGPPSFVNMLPSFHISPPPNEKSTKRSDDKENMGWFSPRSWWSTIKDLLGIAIEEETDPSWAGPACRRQRYRRRSSDKNTDPNTLFPTSWWSGNKYTDRRRGSTASLASSDSSSAMPDLGWFSNVPGRKKAERRRRKTLGPLHGIWD
ncbi:Hypp5979 [Branchiostoma lanceolatum]|uniref:Hypp5979 protein n=1 Tax=Branchiostoma lanceolatum TaxID=7740 RepID=A0A8J9VHB4_BRALA|nr:Hypp5979 [Branchiostoma lanceolatum]